MIFKTSCLIAALAVTSPAISGFTAVPSSPGSRLASSTIRRHVSAEPKNDLFGTPLLCTFISSSVVSVCYSNNIVLPSVLFSVDATSTQSSVQDYYGKTLATSDDLKTNACCAAAAPPSYIKEAIDNINPEVKAKYYGW